MEKNNTQFVNYWFSESQKTIDTPIEEIKKVFCNNKNMTDNYDMKSVCKNCSCKTKIQDRTDITHKEKLITTLVKLINDYHILVLDDSSSYIKMPVGGGYIDRGKYKYHKVYDLINMGNTFKFWLGSHHLPSGEIVFFVSKVFINSCENEDNPSYESKNPSDCIIDFEDYYRLFELLKKQKTEGNIVTPDFYNAYVKKLKEKTKKDDIL